MVKHHVRTKAELLQLIEKAADECWTEFDLAGSGLEALPPEIGKLIQLKKLILGEHKQSPGYIENKIDTLPEELWELSNLQSLALPYIGIEKIPDEISQLKHLTHLDLGHNKISDFSDNICQLVYLQDLRINNNKITQIPESISKLSSLISLDLSFNQIEEIPESLAYLENLVSLALNNNKISFFSNSFSQLTSLERLLLSYNKISNIPKNFCRLKSLKYLDAGDNNIPCLPSTIGQLSSLLELKLNYNQISDLPDSFSQLESLRILNLNNNHISDIPEVIGQLKRLTNLYLSNNMIHEVSDTLSQLRVLDSLHLSYNRLSQISEGISNLSSLSALYLASNKISEIPEKISYLLSLKTLNLANNQIDEFPTNTVDQITTLENLDLRDNCLPFFPELLGPSDLNENPGPVEEILNYARQLQVSEKLPLNEAKILFVGQSGVGKTSLINRLLNDDFDILEPQTDGLEVHDWEIKVNSKKIDLNVWDFGGQEIYHTTHQFFLTKRSLYLLVCNCRTSEEENRLEYWLKLIQSFGGSSPVIIVGNKKDEQLLDINERALRDKYPNIKAILSTSCKSGEGTAKLKEAIETEVGQLKEVYDLLPPQWFEVKKQLESMDQDFIKYSQYERICENQGITEEENQEQLIRLLHNLGIVLNYRDHPILSNTNVLNPDWVTDGIYGLFSDDDLKTAKGILRPSNLNRILDAERYPTNRHSFLIQLLEKFQLGFELPNSPEERRFLLPGLLPKEEPAKIRLKGETLELQYHYKILPASVISRFIVLMHEKIHEGIYWRSGVMLSYCKGDETFNIARIKADPEDKKVFVSVSGYEHTRREFLGIICDTFTTIHTAFAEPADVTEWVPVPEHPHHPPLDYLELLGLEVMGVREYPIGKLRTKIDLQQLLDGYEPFDKRQDRSRREEASSTTIIINNDNKPVSNNTTNNLRDANIGNFANELKDNAQQTASNFTQTNGATTADLLQLITALRDQAQPFPEAQREDILIDLEDLEEQAQKPAEQRSLPRIKKRLLAILTAATVAGGAVATAADFTNNITDLGQKFGIAPTELQLPPAK